MSQKNYVPSIGKNSKKNNKMSCGSFLGIYHHFLNIVTGFPWETTELGAIKLVFVALSWLEIGSCSILLLFKKQIFFVLIFLPFLLKRALENYEVSLCALSINTHASLLAISLVILNFIAFYPIKGFTKSKFSWMIYPTLHTLWRR